ncbi:MAG: metallophosphoesterase [Bacillota bacterium]
MFIPMENNSYPCMLLMNDMHIGKENIPEFITNWNEALEICDRLNIKTIAIGGDLFMSRASQTLDILRAVHECLLRATGGGISVILANGNHDLLNQESIYGYCNIFSEFPDITVVGEYYSMHFGDDCLLHIIPYYPENGKFVDILNKVKSQSLVKGKKNYLYIHEGVNGALSTPAEKEVPANIFTEFDWVYAGHYHNRCIVPESNVEFIGSSRQHNFGEDEAKGYTVLYSDGTSEFIQNRANIRYRVIEVDADKVDIHLTDMLDELKESGRYRTKVKVRATSEKSTSIDKAKLLEAGASKVEIIVAEIAPIEVASSSLFEKFDNSKIRETYNEFCQEREIEDVELGLSYLK